MKPTLRDKERKLLTNDQIKCPWCQAKVLPEETIVQRKCAEVVESNCPRCGKIISARLKSSALGSLIFEQSMISEKNSVKEK